MIDTNKNKWGTGQTGITGQDVVRYGPPRNKSLQDFGEPTDQNNRRKQEKIERMLINERDAQREIYGRNFELKGFKETLLRYPLDALEYWESMGWEPIYFPRIDITKESFFRDPEIGEEKLSFKEQVGCGRILEAELFDGYIVDQEALILKGITVLAEKEPYDFSRQIFKKIREELRQGDEESIDVWEEKLRPAFAKSMKVKISRVRLKRVAEKFILQFYRKKLNRKQEEEDLWEWCFECFDTPFNRLRGNSFRLEPGWYYENRNDTSFYPLIVL